MTTLKLTSESLLHVLRLENDTLRRQVQQIHGGMACLPQQQQRTCQRNSVADMKNNGSSSEMGYVAHLEQRCLQLASRLVSVVRDRQLSECSELHFLLRTQEEERRFLRDALMTLLKKQKGQIGDDDDDEWQLENDVSSGTLSALVMRVTDSLQSREAQLKLEKAESLVVIEQTTNLIVDLQQAVEKAARLVYSHHFDFSLSTPLQKLALCTESHSSGTVKMQSLKDITLDRLPLLSSHTQQGSSSTERHWRENTRSFIDPALAFMHGTGAATSLRKGDLLEACDILRACHRALGDVRLLLGSVKSPTALFSLSKGDKQTNLEHLLEEFQRDLREMARNHAKSQEALARRLMAEIEAHGKTVKKYEARLKLAEKELVEHLTSSTHFTQMPLKPSDTDVLCLHKRSGEEADNDTSVADDILFPPPSLLSTSLCCPAVRGDITQRETTPENFVPPLHLNGGKSEWGRGEGDVELKGKEKNCVFATARALEGMGVQPELLYTLSTPNTLADGVHSDSIEGGSAAHSPLPSPLSSRQNYGQCGEKEKHKAMVSSKQRPHSTLLSPSVL